MPRCSVCLYGCRTCSRISRALRRYCTGVAATPPSVPWRTRQGILTAPLGTGSGHKLELTSTSAGPRPGPKTPCASRDAATQSGSRRSFTVRAGHTRHTHSIPIAVKYKTPRGTPSSCGSSTLNRHKAIFPFAQGLTSLRCPAVNFAAAQQNNTTLFPECLQRKIKIKP